MSNKKRAITLSGFSALITTKRKDYEVKWKQIVFKYSMNLFVNQHKSLLRPLFVKFLPKKSLKHCHKKTEEKNMQKQKAFLRHIWIHFDSSHASMWWEKAIKFKEYERSSYKLISWIFYANKNNVEQKNWAVVPIMCWCQNWICLLIL